MRRIMTSQKNKNFRIKTKRKGFIKENTVVQYLKNQGWAILYQNKKILGVEIDILAKKEQEHFLIEVKSITKDDHLEKILKSKQKERLKKVAQSLCEDFPKGLRLLLATVDSKNEVSFFEIS